MTGRQEDRRTGGRDGTGQRDADDWRTGFPTYL